MNIIVVSSLFCFTFGNIFAVHDNGISKIRGHPILVRYSEETSILKCPKPCTCTSLTVDCSNEGLPFVHPDLPLSVERLDLQGNNLTILLDDDFQNLSQLRTLQLMDNIIRSISNETFRDLIQLERLRLNNNRISHIPDGLFVTSSHLVRLDMSHNKIQKIRKDSFYGAVMLKTLHLDFNEISCIDAGAIYYLKELEILMLNNNKLLTLPDGLFQDLYRLRTLRISDNRLHCDCRLSWLARWLQKYPKLGQYTRCASPAHLNGQMVANLGENEFRCSADNWDEWSRNECDSKDDQCPALCKCDDSIIDCRGKLLTKIPSRLPNDSIELRLEQNHITEIPSRAFSQYKRLRRIDLSKNFISKIASNSFDGLKSLTSLILYGNMIKELSGNVFHGLESLQLLLLNANEISCVRTDTFKYLHNLNLLSLYDNNIKTLRNGTFDDLKNIQTLHLAKNPFVCDCNLKWLGDYLHKHPIETSGAKCESPKRMQRRRLDSLIEEKMQCVDNWELDGSSDCYEEIKCPIQCICDGTIVDCSSSHLVVTPNDVPVQTTELLFIHNGFKIIKAEGLMSKLPNLRTLDFRKNNIVRIEDNAFEGASKLIELNLSHNKLREVNIGMLKGLHNLKVLLLNDNLVKCVISGAFDSLPRLQTLNLQSNPLVCNCHTAWLADWLRKKQFLDSVAHCGSPATLKDSRIHELLFHQFVCKDDDEPSCFGENHCPARCVCAGTVVQCSRLNFTEVPKNLPAGTFELELQGNNITTLSTANFRRLVNLQVMDLSNNQITMLSNYTFSSLSELSTLIVSYNKIICIEKNAFVGLKKLKIISLHGNDISVVPDGIFVDSREITHLALGSNPLYCDCNLRWLAEWVKKDFIEPGIAKCAEPISMKDKLILNTPVSHFQCKEAIRKEVLSKCNPCLLLPCFNNATCELDDRSSPTCHCPPGYYGKWCEYVIDACYGNPCRHGGICKLLEEGRFSCVCPPGLTGDRCEVNINDCVDNECQNNATCIDLVDSYECKCSKGYEGKFCENKISYCTKEFDPCENGGRCIDHFTHYTCECSSGFRGDNCSVNVDDCVNNMCQNGGICIDGVNNYTCKCQSDHAGKYCEVEPMVAMLYPQTTPCQHHDCKNGVCFQPNNSIDYICKCAFGYTGKRCEYLTSVTFARNKSFAQLEPLKTKPDTNVTILFSSKQDNGIILYDGQMQHLAVELFNGRIRVSFDVGNYPPSSMFSFETVSDGKYHVVELLCIQKNFTLRVDYGKARTIVNEGPRDYLKLASPLFIGGMPTEIGLEAVNKFHLRNLTNFNGCMKEVWVNHKLVDFSNVVKQQNIAPGCGSFENDERNSNMNDQNDERKPTIEGNQNLCPNSDRKDKTVSCRKEFDKMYYSENECQSIKAIQIAKCDGMCGAGCCQPKKLKKKRIKLICSDGTRYTKDVNVPSKCGCAEKDILDKVRF